MILKWTCKYNINLVTKHLKSVSSKHIQSKAKINLHHENKLFIAIFNWTKVVHQNKCKHIRPQNLIRANQLKLKIISSHSAERGINNSFRCHGKRAQQSLGAHISSASFTVPRRAASRLHMPLEPASERLSLRRSLVCPTTSMWLIGKKIVLTDIFGFYLVCNIFVMVLNVNFKIELLSCVF